MKRFDQINVIPFIDIMLVLLAIVLTTATFISTQQLKLDLPAAENSSSPHPEETVNISIDTGLAFYFEKQPVSLTTLEKKLQPLASETAIVLSVDKAVAFEQFIQVIDLLKTRNLENLSIVVKNP